jgi:hypothetical protein
MSNENPYAPSTEYESPLLAAGPVRNVVPKFNDILSYAWNIWKENLLLVFVATLITFAISFALSFGGGFAEGLLQNNGQPTIASTAVSVSTAIINNLLGIFLGIGNVQLLLALLRRQPATLGMLFGGGERFLPALGYSILFLLAVTAGFVLLIVPGFFLLFRYWPGYYLVIDRRTPVMEAFTLAGEITRGNTLNTFRVGLMGTGIGLLGFLACIVGILFAQPLAMLLFGTAYLMMSSQIDPKTGPEFEPPVL